MQVKTALSLNEEKEEERNILLIGDKAKEINYGRWKIIRDNRKYIIIFWIAFICPIGRYCHSKFIESTDSTFEAIKGTPSYDAQQVYNENYLPNTASSTTINPPILIYLKQKQSQHNQEETMIDGVSKLYKETRSFCYNYSDYLISLGTSPGDVVIQHYYALEELNLKVLATNAYTRNNGTDIIMTVQTMFSHSQIYNFIDSLQNYGSENHPPQLEISYTGMQIFQQDMIQQAKKDTLVMDLISLPTALLVLCYVLQKNIPLLLIPLLMIATTVNLWSIIMLFISYFIKVTQTTPSVMTSLSLAMGIDYSLFILSRIQQELSVSSSKTNDRKRVDEALLISLENTGYSILVSGTTIMLCLFGLILLPMEMFTSMGIGCGLAIASCLIVNLTLVPSLLFTQFGRNLLLSTSFVHCCCCKENKNLSQKPNDDNQETEELEEPLLQIKNTETKSSKEYYQEQKQQQQVEEPIYDGFWFQLGKRYIYRPTNVILFSVIILFFVLPIASFIPELQTTISNQLMLPSNSPALNAYQELSKTFGQGYLAPYHLIFDGSSSEKNMNITSNVGFQVMQLVHEELSKNKYSQDSYAGIAIMHDRNIIYEEYVQAIQCGIYCSNEGAATLSYVDSQNTASSHTTYISIILSHDPFSSEGTNWLSHSRTIIEDLEKQGKLQGFQVYLHGGASIAYDSMTTTYFYFPKMITVTSLVVLILMGFSFKSVATPLRSLLSISCTLMFSYGLFVLVYQKGILNWTGIDSISAFRPSQNENGLVSFIPPIMAFTVIVGLSLDYDVFLLTRIFEYRIQEGYYHKSSILLGLQGTGTIITAAGLIMSVAFGGLLASSNKLLNQYAFLLTVSALLDTFIIRTILVPILLSFTGSYYSWWPMDVGKEEKSVLEDEIVAVTSDNDATSVNAGILETQKEWSHNLL